MRERWGHPGHDPLLQGPDHLLDAIVKENIVRVIAFVWDSIAAGVDDSHDMVQGLVSRIIQALDEMPWLLPLWKCEIVNEGGLLRESMLQRFPRQSGEEQRGNITTAPISCPIQEGSQVILN